MIVFQRGNTKFARVVNMGGHECYSEGPKKTRKWTDRNLVKFNIDIKSCIWDVLTVRNGTASGCQVFSEDRYNIFKLHQPAKKLHLSKKLLKNKKYKYDRNI